MMKKRIKESKKAGDYLFFMISLILFLFLEVLKYNHDDENIWEEEGDK